jgi:hypothetical protein
VIFNKPPGILPALKYSGKFHHDFVEYKGRILYDYLGNRDMGIMARLA